MAALRLGDRFFALATPAPSWTAYIAVTVGRALGETTCSLLERQDGHGHMPAILLEQRVIPIFFAITPVRMTKLLIQRPAMRDVPATGLLSP